MGTELQAKYTRLTQEYAKVNISDTGASCFCNLSTFYLMPNVKILNVECEQIRAQVDVLKKAIRDEKAQKNSIEVIYAKE